MSKTKSRSVGKLLAKGVDVVGLHVTMEAYLDGKIRQLVGTIKEVAVEDIPIGFSQRLVIHHFNGEPWPLYPLPAHVTIIERD
jgi:hypothetical protein